MPAEIGEKLRAALRSIVRDWRALRNPLPVDAISPRPGSGAQSFQVRGAESHEDLLERAIKLAGRVWQLKDGLIKWLAARPSFRIVVTDANTGSVFVGTGGEGAERTIEETAKLSLWLLLCADLYNTHKHYDNCNRSGYQPFLNGVHFDTSKAGGMGIRFDGATKTGEMTVANATPIPVRIEVASRNHPVSFGDAIVVIGRAFQHWVPLVRQMGLLVPPDRADVAILDDLIAFENVLKNLHPFDPSDSAIDLDKLPIDQRALAHRDPAAFVAKLQTSSGGGTVN